MFDESYPNRLVIISGLMFLSGAFDNWQRKIGKLWQYAGKASLMQRRTAALMTRMKCFELPRGTVVSSPTGIHFRVRNTDRVDAYTIVNHRTVLPIGDSSTTLNADDVPARQSELEKINTEGFLWPTYGWDVLHIGKFDQCHEPEYVGQYIPAP